MTPAEVLRAAADALTRGDGPDWSAHMTNEVADQLAAWLRAAADATDAYPAAADADGALARIMRSEDRAPAYRAAADFIQHGLAFARSVLGETGEGA